VPTESSAKKWNQTRLPVTQRWRYNNRHTTVMNNNIDKIYHVRTESSAKKWSQTRLPVTQRYATATSRNAF
jgi:hypothetical protein